MTRPPWPDWVPASLAGWFQAHFDAPTQTQKLAWRRTFHGGHALILAPTGSGKTLAAFFSVLAQLGARAHRDKLPNACLAVYVSPLRALGRDIYRNLEEPLAAINAALPAANRIRMEIRTGDTSTADRERMARRRPHLLLTTPESLSSLLSQQPWREGFQPETVIVDEIHSFAENKRGSLLALTLERLQARAPHILQRIGLSATAQPAEAVAQLLCGRRPCAIVSDSIRRMHRLEIHAPAHLPAAGYDPGRIAHAVIDAVQHAHTTLAFTATRSAAERLGLALSLLLPDAEDSVGAPHSRTTRAAVSPLPPDAGGTIDAPTRRPTRTAVAPLLPDAGDSVGTQSPRTTRASVSPLPPDAGDTIGAPTRRPTRAASERLGPAVSPLPPTAGDSVGTQPSQTTRAAVASLPPDAGGTIAGPTRRSTRMASERLGLAVSPLAPTAGDSVGTQPSQTTRAAVTSLPPDAGETIGAPARRATRAAVSPLLPATGDTVGVHHASIERQEREALEARLAAGAMRVVVCSTSLEMGVDYANVDQVLLIGTPRGVSRALQRLGRSGHRAGGVAFGRIVPLSLPDLLEALAMRQAVLAGYIEDLVIPQNPLDVLAQCLLGMAVERPHRVEEAWELVRAAGPYLHLTRADFDAALAYLAGGGQVLARFGKIVIENGEFRVASARLAREYFQAIGTISEDFRVRIVTKNYRRLGEVEEGFLSSLRPGEAFSIGGKAVEVETIHGAIAVVKPSASDRVVAPRWMGGKMPLSSRMAEEELRLRGYLRTAWNEGGRPNVEAVLREVYQATNQQAELAGEFIERQCRAAPIPIDSPVQVEFVGRGRRVAVMVHCVAGRAVNQSLAWVAAHRLAAGESVVSNSDDHGHLLVLPAKLDLSEAALRRVYNPAGFLADLEAVLKTTDTLGRRFRGVAETGQLVKRRGSGHKFQAWNGALIYQTLLTYEPDHLLVKETVREVLGDLLDAPNAVREAGRIFESPWELYAHPRPSPFALPLFAAFNREVLLAQDPSRAFDEFAAAVYEEWND